MKHVRRGRAYQLIRRMPFHCNHEIGNQPLEWMKALDSRTGKLEAGLKSYDQILSFLGFGHRGVSFISNSYYKKGIKL